MRQVLSLFIFCFLIACGGQSVEKIFTTSSDTEKHNISHSFIEGNDSNNVFNIRFTAIQSGQLKYQTFNINAVDKSDYVAINGSLNVIAGEEYTLNIEVIADTRIESDERFGLLIEDEAGVEFLNYTLIIINDDFPKVSIVGTDITEGDVGRTHMSFEILLSESIKSSLTIEASTARLEGIGLANPSEDYIPFSQTLVFIEGEISKTIEVEIISDTLIEPDEKVSVNLTYLSGLTQSSSAYIRTDDYPGSGAPNIVINQGRSLQVSEGNDAEQNSIPFSLESNSDFNTEIVLNYKLRELQLESEEQNDRAILGEDFNDSLSQVIISPDQLHYQVNFEIIDDRQLERTELLEIVIFNEAGVEFASSRIYISDNETPSVSIYKKITNASGILENSSQMHYMESSNDLGVHKVHVELDTVAGYEYQLDYIVRLANSGEVGQAINKDDWEQNINGNIVQTKRLTFERGSRMPSGSDADGIIFTLNDDNQIEGHESFFIELKTVSGHSVLEPVEVVIFNDDMPEIVWVDNSNTPANSGEFTLLEGGELFISLQLVGQQGIGSKALEDFELNIFPVSAETEGCRWRQDSGLLDNEYQLINNNVTTFSAGLSAVSMEFQSINDTSVECTEAIKLVAELTSKLSHIGRVSRATKVINVNDDDKAYLDVYGFSVDENTGNADFEFKLNSDVAFEFGFELEHVSTEDEDGIFSLSGQAINIGNGTNNTRYRVVFDESNRNRDVVIEGTIQVDEKVELTEDYRLTVYLDTYQENIDVIPIGIRLCATKLQDPCEVVVVENYPGSVIGRVVNADKVTLSLMPKDGISIPESELTAINLLEPNYKYPYKIVLDKSIASDVPRIELSLSDRCLLLMDDDCASIEDYGLESTVIHDGLHETLTNEVDLAVELMMDDELVEPDEVIKLTASIDNQAALNDYISGWSNQTIDFTITNDDKINFSLIRPLSNNYLEGNEGELIDLGYKISWDRNIAANVPLISIKIIESCDEAINDLCLLTVEHLGSVSGDLQFSDSMIIHDSIDETHANLLGVSLSVGIVGDETVEPMERGELQLTIDQLSAESAEDFPYLSLTSWNGSNEIFNVLNDDKLTFSFSTVTTELAEGDEVNINTGLEINWDKAIADNVDDIGFWVSEECDNLTETRCVSDLESADYIVLKSQVFIHEKNIATEKESHLNAGVFVVGDELLEPDEFLNIKLSLIDTVDQDNVLFTPWLDQSVSLVIVNDDLITPRMEFNNLPDISHGDENSNNQVDLVITWGDVEIAENVSDLDLEISHVCNNCGSGLADYQIDSGLVSLSNLAASGQLEFNFSISEDTVVEPDEIVQLSLKKKNSTPNGYFSSIPADDVFSSLEYTINNDDRILVSIHRADGTSNHDLPEKQLHPLNVSWQGHIADNLPELSIQHILKCDDDVSDSTLTKCIDQTSILNNSPADIDLSAFTMIAAADTEVDARILAFERALALEVNNDTWVEIDERLKIEFSVPSELMSYIRFDTALSDEQNPDFVVINDYRIINDDELTVNLGSSVTRGHLTRESDEGAISHTITFNTSVENDVGDLDLELVKPEDSGVNYATQSITFSQIEDYQIFWGEESEENLINNTIRIKALGETLSATSKLLTVRVSDDNIVESDEKVAFKIRENSNLILLEDLGSPIANNVESNERSFTILLEDTIDLGLRLSSSLLLPETTMVVESDADQEVFTMLTGIKPIDHSVGNLTVNVSVSCVDAIPMTCTSAEASVNAIALLEPSTVTQSSILDIGLVIKGDQIIEPSEIIEIELSVSDKTEYFDLSGTLKKQLSINNDDLLTLELTNNSAPIIEGDISDSKQVIKIIVSDEGGGVEGMQTINYVVTQVDAVGDNAEATGDNSDFEFFGALGNHSIDLANLFSPLTGSIEHDILEIENDHHIEKNEKLAIKLALTLPSEYSVLGENPELTQTYIISDDDYLTLSMHSSAMQEEGTADYQILVCDKLGEGVESIINLELSAAGVFLDATTSEYLASNKLADDSDDYSLSNSVVTVNSSDINDSNTFLGHECAIKSLPILILDDSEIELDEWFGITLGSNDSYLCSAANNLCLQQNLVITNDDTREILDSGVLMCINSSGALVETNAGVCTELSLQDVELDYPDNQYTYINDIGKALLNQWESGVEVQNNYYACLSDNYSGLIWSIDRLPFDGIHSSDGKAWLGAVLEEGAVFERLFSENGFCNIKSSTKKWQLPSVEQLMGVINFSQLESDSGMPEGIFKVEELAGDSFYWTKDSCDTDTDVSTKEFWAVDFKQGTLHCKSSSEQLLLRAVYY